MGFPPELDPCPHGMNVTSCDICYRQRREEGELRREWARKNAKKIQPTFLQLMMTSTDCFDDRNEGGVE